MDRIEPYRQIVQLQSEIVKISRRNSDLKRKCSELEAELTEKRTVVTQPETELPIQPQPFVRPTKFRARVPMLIRVAASLILLRNSGA
jgi:hypothetical protein